MNVYSEEGLALSIIKGSDLTRWKRKARRCFTINDHLEGYDKQADRALDLAKDVFRVLDPSGWRKKR